jgi:site-specific recombinase XerD
MTPRRHLADVDLARGWLTLRHTKTRWDRVVPMGERASAWPVRYLAGSRPQLQRDESTQAVFLATNGEQLGATWLTGQVHRYVEASGTGKSGSCHLLRHSAATLMLPLCAAWLVLGALMTWVLAVPPARRSDVPSTSSQASGKASPAGSRAVMPMTTTPST